jgi:D-apionolactonase
VTTAENAARLFEPFQTIEAGQWCLQLRGDELADIQYGGCPVLRAIRPVVRDHDWRTLSPIVESVTRGKDEGLLTVRLSVQFAGYGARYSADVTVQLGQNELIVTFHGIAPEDFYSNRIGLVVLHRPDEAGRAVVITAPDGTRAQHAFPIDISPHQPFLDVAAMSWERDGTTFHLGFTGDVFETEDQRNWTDASFKTYSTPLSRPFPVAVRAGDSVKQRIRLTAEPTGEAEAPPLKPASELLTVRSRGRAQVPALGTSSSRSDTRLDAVPGMDALIVEVSGDDISEAEGILARALRESGELGVRMDVRITASTPGHLGRVLDLLPLEQVARIGVFSSNEHITEPELWAELRAETRRRGLTATLLAGARSHFTELNRRQDTLPGDAGAFTYSVTPQMHATEVPHIVESLPMQRQTALNALRMGSGKPLHVGPITLKARYNAVSTDGAYDSKTTEAMTTDPLQAETFTAAWMLGSIAAMTLPGVESLSYFEASGPRGLLTDDGTPTPAFELLVKLAALRGADVLEVEGNVPGLVLYPVRADSAVVLFAANLTPEPLRTAVRFEHGESIQTVALPAWSVTTRPLS